MKRLRNRQLTVSRVLLVVTGLIVGALAALGLLLATGAVDRLTRYAGADQPVLNPATRADLTTDTVAAQLITAAVAVVLIGVGLAWLALQVPPVRRYDDVSTPNADPVRPGHNLLRGRALARALEDDLETAEVIRRAQAELRHDGSLVRLRLDVADDPASIDLVDRLVDDVVLPAVDRLATVAGLDGRPALQVDLRPVEPV